MGHFTNWQNGAGRHCGNTWDCLWAKTAKSGRVVIALQRLPSQKQCCYKTLAVQQDSAFQSPKISRQPSKLRASRDSQYPPLYENLGSCPCLACGLYWNHRGLIGSPRSAALRAALCFCSSRCFWRLACGRGHQSGEHDGA